MAALLLAHVPHIFALCPGEQVVRVHASRIVAPVAHDVSLGDRASEKLIADTMGASPAAREPYPGVCLVAPAVVGPALARTLPFPTTIVGSVGAHVQEPVFQGASLPGHICLLRFWGPILYTREQGPPASDP